MVETKGAERELTPRERYRGFHIRLISAQYKASERFKLLTRLHSDLQTHAGNKIDQTDPGGQFS